MTTKAKHTPGPWVWEDQMDGRSRGYIRAGQVMYEGALHPPAVAKICLRDSYNDEVIANGRLIAAAPAMWELVMMLGVGKPLDWQTVDALSLLSDAVKKARAIKRQVEGRAEVRHAT